MFEEIKESLPNFPEEIISAWLLPIAESGYGWPPVGGMSCKWRYALARQSLDYWQKTKWEKQPLPLGPKDFKQLSQQSIAGIIEGHIKNQHNIYSNIQNSRERFFRLLGYVYEHGTLPVAPIVMSEEGALELIDGNHRMAALTFARLLWNHPKHKAEMIKAGYTLPFEQHETWLITPPAEGEYIPDAQTEAINIQYKKWLEEKAKRPKKTFRVPIHD